MKKLWGFIIIELSCIILIPFTINVQNLDTSFGQATNAIINIYKMPR